MKRSGLKTKTENNHGRTNAYSDAYTVANTNTYTDTSADAYAYTRAYTRADTDAYADAHTHTYARADTDANWRRADNSCCGGRSGHTAANANAHTRADRHQRGRLRDESDDRHGDREGR